MSFSFVQSAVGPLQIEDISFNIIFLTYTIIYILIINCLILTYYTVSLLGSISMTKFSHLFKAFTLYFKCAF